MASMGWVRRSSTAKTYRVSNPQFGLDGGMRQGPGGDRQSRIPMRASSSQAANKERPSHFQQLVQRSKSVAASGDTPVGGNAYTPLESGSGVSRGCSSKKMNFCKDQRNLHDKEYLKESAFLVQRFFQDKRPDLIVNGVEIKPMTIKMFIGMVNFLFETLSIKDVRQEPVCFSVNTYQKDLPYWMKKLNYPGFLNKAWLQTVNVPNNWHHVVGLLSWLVKICEISSLFNIEELLMVDDDDLNKLWSTFYFESSLKVFSILQSNNHDEYKSLCCEVIQKFYELNRYSEEEFAEAEAEVEELRKKLEDPETLGGKDALDEALQRVLTLETQGKKVIQDISQAEDNIELTKAKIAEKEKNCEMLKKAIEEKRKCLENVKTVVSQQPTSVFEVAEVRKKSENVDKEIKFLEKECEDYSQLIAKYDSEAAVKRDKILQSTHAFNRSIIQLEQIIPELKEFRVYKEPEDAEIVEEMKGIVESLGGLKSRKAQTCRDLEKQLAKTEQDIEEKTQALNNITEKIAKLEESIEHKRKSNLSLMEEFEEMEKTLKAKSEKWDEKIEAIEDKLKEFAELKEKEKKLKLRHKDLVESLDKAEELAEDFWRRKNEKWERIPEQLEALLDRVRTQNAQLSEGYKDLFAGAKASVVAEEVGAENRM